MLLAMGSARPPAPSASPTLGEMLRASLWARSISPDELSIVERSIVERPVPAGAYACRKGEPVEHWIGCIAGLLKMTSLAPSGKVTTFTGLQAGSWFGEGSLLKDEARRYDVMAIRASRIALMPKATFQWLLDNSIAFNRFLLLQLNERLGQFIGLVEYGRLLDVEGRVARCLASLFNPVLYPGIGMQLAISQEEIGYLAGVSRQRVNRALKTLEQAELLRLEYGGLVVLDLDGLRTYGG